MYSDEMSLNERAILLSFVYIQLIVFVVAAVVVSSFPDTALRIFSEMPPVSAIYSSVDAAWISKLLHFGYGMVAITNVLLGVFTVMISMKSAHQPIKFLGAFFGVQLVLTGLLCLSIVIILEIGGIAHLASILIVLSTTMLTLLTLLMVVSKRRYIKQFIASGDVR